MSKLENYLLFKLKEIGIVNIIMNNINFLRQQENIKKININFLNFLVENNKDKLEDIDLINEIYSCVTEQLFRYEIVKSGLDYYKYTKHSDSMIIFLKKNININYIDDKFTRIKNKKMNFERINNTRHNEYYILSIMEELFPFEDKIFNLILSLFEEENRIEFLFNLIDHYSGDYKYKFKLTKNNMENKKEIINLIGDMLFCCIYKTFKKNTNNINNNDNDNDTIVNNNYKINTIKKYFNDYIKILNNVYN